MWKGEATVLVEWSVNGKSWAHTAESVAGRRVHLAGLPSGSGFKDIGVRVRLRYQMLVQRGIMGTLGCARLSGDAEDSPVVDGEGSADQMTGGVMVPEMGKNVVLDKRFGPDP